MREISFVDTNILVYAYDSSSDIKHNIAMDLIDSLWENQNGILSTQVLCEFFVTITRKVSNPIPINSAKQIIGDYLSSWEIVLITQDMIIDAIDGSKNYCLSFWDSLIWIAAKHSGANRVYSEDFQHNLVIDDVKFINPFL